MSSDKDNFFIAIASDAITGQVIPIVLRLAPAKAPVPNLCAMLTGAQIRAARALLRWSGARLAKESGVSYPALQRAEAVDDVPNMHTRNLAAIQSTLEAAGVVFLERGDTRDGGQGVRLK